MQQANAVSLVTIELVRAQLQHAPMASPHEGYAVILEELDELWAEVKKQRRSQESLRAELRAEATQVAAMALRFLIDCC